MAACFAAVAVSLAAPQTARAQVHAELCDRDSQRCRWWRPLGGYRRHERDLEARLTVGAWSHDDLGRGIEILDVAGVLATYVWDGGSLGLTAAARGALAGESFASPTMGLGAYVGSRFEGIRLVFDARFPVGGQALEHGDAEARALGLTGLALGETDDPLWVGQIRSGYSLRVSLLNRFPLPGTWDIWLNARCAFGSVRIATPAAAALGGLGARETSLGSLWLELMFGDAASGFRFGARASAGIGATLPTETIAPIHADLVVGYEVSPAMQFELFVGFTAIPLGGLLYPDTTLADPALPSAMFRLTVYPIAPSVRPQRHRLRASEPRPPHHQDTPS